MDFSTWFRNTYEKSKKVFTSADMRRAYIAGSDPKRAKALDAIEAVQQKFKAMAKEKARRRLYD